MWCGFVESAVKILAAHDAKVQREAEARGLERADKLSEALGLELLAKGDKAGWSALDEFGHGVRALIPHVSPSGNDANAGSEAAPKETPL